MSGEDGLVARQRAAEYVDDLVGSDTYEIAAPTGGRWIRKAYLLLDHYDIPAQLLAKRFFFEVLINPRKAIFVRPQELHALPEDLAQEVPDDDAYLFQTALAANARKIVTTDLRLIDRVRTGEPHGIRLIVPEDFFPIPEPLQEPHADIGNS